LVSVRGWLGLEPFNLVLERQLATLQPRDLEVIRRGMGKGFVDLAIDVAVLALKLFKMGCKRHDWFSRSWFPRCTIMRREPALPANMTVQ
jgi:hypothetical protein